MILLFNFVTSSSASTNKNYSEKGVTQVIKTWRVTESGLVELTPEQVDQLYKDEELNKQRRNKYKESFLAKKN